MNRQETEQIKSTINWLLQNGDFKDTTTAYNIAMNSINTLEEQLTITGVVFNEAVTDGNWVLDEPEPLYKDYEIEEKSEVELFCSNCKSTHVYQPEPESIKCYRCGFYGAK